MALQRPGKSSEKPKTYSAAAISTKDVISYHTTADLQHICRLRKIVMRMQ